MHYLSGRIIFYISEQKTFITVNVSVLMVICGGFLIVYISIVTISPVLSKSFNHF